MRVDDLSQWQAFVAICLQGNFSKAAKSLNMGIPQLSKKINKLELDLGVRLFQRTTRKITLTDEARALLPKVSSILDDMKGIEDSFEKHTELSGTIRITAVPFLAHKILMKKITEFSKLHPKVKFELDLSEDFKNLIEGNFDLAYRIHQQPEDSSLIYKKIAPNSLVLCATPEYLKMTKAPLKKLEDLKQHQMLVLDVHKKCAFMNGLKMSEYTKVNRLSCQNGWFLTELALQHQGILLRSRIDVEPFLKTGVLKEIFPQAKLEAGNIYAVIPSKRLLAPRVKAFLEFN